MSAGTQLAFSLFVSRTPAYGVVRTTFKMSLLPQLTHFRYSLRHAEWFVSEVIYRVYQVDSSYRLSYRVNPVDVIVLNSGWFYFLNGSKCLNPCLRVDIGFDILFISLRMFIEVRLDCRVGNDTRFGNWC